MGNKGSKSNNNSSSNNSNSNSNNNDRNKGPIATASPLYTTLEQTDEDIAWDLHNRENLAMGRETHAMYGMAPPPRRPLPPLPPPNPYSYGTWNAPPPYQEVVIHNDDDAFVAVFLLMFFFFWLLLWLIIAFTW